MKILNSSLSLVFPPFFNVREQVFELERSLSEHFTSPFALLPVPNEAPPEIPRITASTKHGHSTLVVTLNSIQFTTNFDDEFSGDLDRCVDYIKKHSEKIYATFFPRLLSMIQFTGLVVNIQEQVDPKIGSTPLLNSKFSRLVTESKMHDTMIKYTFAKEDKYYINLQVQNHRLLQPQYIPGSLGQMERTDLLLITLDVNDRFAFNYKPGYLSNYDTVSKVIDLTSEYLRSGVPDLIKNGRFDV